MSKELTVVPSESSYVGSNLPVTREDFETLTQQRKLLQEFVSKQLRKDVDYGIIPGTPKPSLFKPGAEKLAGVFGLGAKFELVDKALDGEKNFALFNYKCIISHRKSGQVIAECDGTANSQEKKYKERTTWVDNKKVKEPTPVYDILNTLQKMAQKRAYVGAVILATGASDFFTQDIDDVADAATVGIVPEVKTAAVRVPTVTKTSSNIEQHADGSPTMHVKALTSIEERQLAKDAGFRWDAAAKYWHAWLTEDEISQLQFRVEDIK